MSESIVSKINGDFDISSHWLYSDLMQIVILPKTLTNLIEFLHEMKSIDNEEALMNLINNCMESLFSIQSIQRIKLLEYIIDKIVYLIDNDEHKHDSRILITLAYCIMTISYIDQNRCSSEINEIKSVCNMLNDNILNKISIKKDSNAHLYLFIVVIIKQLTLWMEYNGYFDEKLQTININKKLRKRSDSICKSLIFLFEKFSLPKKEISINTKRPIHILSILSFYSFVTVESLETEFNKRTTAKRTILIDSNNSQSKRLKSENDTSNNSYIKISKLVSDITEKKSVDHVELIKIFKTTQDIILLSEKEYKKNILNSENYELVFINLVKLWTFGIKEKLMKKFDYNIYYFPLICKEIKGKYFKSQIKSLIDFMMAFQSKLILDIQNNPYWVNALLIGSMECIMTNSTDDKNLTSDEKSDIVELINEVGKLLEVLLQSKNLKHLCRVVVVIPHKVFTFISELKSALYPEVKRAINKNIVGPIFTVLNKHTMDHLKMELNGPAREICREFLEIK